MRSHLDTIDAVADASLILIQAHIRAASFADCATLQRIKAAANELIAAELNLRDNRPWHDHAVNAVEFLRNIQPEQLQCP